MHTVAKLPNDKAGRLFKHILEYVNDHDPVLDDLLLEIAFEPIKQWLKRDLLRREEIKEKRKQAGKMWGEAKASNAKQDVANASFAKQTLANVAVNVNDNVNVNVINNKGGRFAPPSVQEVKKYCQERKNSVNPEQFVNFYTSKGWLVGNAKMKDRKSAVRTWEQRQATNSPPKTKLKTWQEIEAEKALYLKQLEDEAWNRNK